MTLHMLRLKSPGPTSISQLIPQPLSRTFTKMRGRMVMRWKACLHGESPVGSLGWERHGKDHMYHIKIS